MDKAAKAAMLILAVAVGLAAAGAPSASAADLIRSRVAEAAAFSAGLPRDTEPVVVSGAELPALSGTIPQDVFVFRFESGPGWQQITHQVDERRMTQLWGGAPCPEGCELRYVFSGAEGNGLDDDDEVVFMAVDAGDMAPDSKPAGVPGPGYEIELSIPGQGIVGYAYIFASSTLSKDFGLPLVSYTRTPIDLDTEDTSIVTLQYYMHFSRLWVIDVIEVLADGGGDGVDLLDRWKGRAYALSLSGETEDIVGMCGGWSNHNPSWGVHTYLGHIDGPVRAIRSIQGACSWPNLTRVDLFYSGMAQMILNLRGHAFSEGQGGLWAYWDYEEAALPMTYYNPLVPDGTIIDGLNDPAYPNGDIGPEITQGWEQVDSAHGGIVSFTQETIDVPGPFNAFIWDNVGYDDGTGEDPPGDPGVIGGNGFHVRYIGNTDPALGGTPAQMVSSYWPIPANLGLVGDSYEAVALNPLTITASPFPTVCGNGVIEGTEGCDDNNTTPDDGCSATCQVELCFACTGAPSSCSCDVGSSGCGGLCVGFLTCSDAGGSCKCVLPQ